MHVHVHACNDRYLNLTWQHVIVKYAVALLKIYPLICISLCDILQKDI